MCVLDDAQQRVPWWRRWVNLTGPGLVSVAEVLEAGRTGPGVEPHGVSGAVVELGGGGGQQGHGAPLAPPAGAEASDTEDAATDATATTSSDNSEPDHEPTGQPWADVAAEDLAVEDTAHTGDDEDDDSYDGEGYGDV